MKKQILLFTLFTIITSIKPVTAQNKSNKVDTRIDDIGYWMEKASEGLVQFNPKVPLKPAEFNGSNTKEIKGIKSITSSDIPVTTQTDVTESENSVFVDPNNSQFILNSNNSTDWDGSSISNNYGANYFQSSNGGSNWTGSVYGAGGTNRGDPSTAINLAGRQFVGYINSSSGMSVSYSDDGNIWIPKTVYNNNGLLQDKEHIWVDNSTSSSYTGNLYNAWVDFSGSTNEAQILFSRSTDNGLNWSVPIIISSAVNAGSYNMAPNIQTGPNGEVYVVWAIYDNWPDDEVALGFAKSSDGGATFAPATRIISNIKGIRTSGVMKNHRVNSFPVMAVDISGGTNNGNIYIVWTNIGVPGINTGTNRSIYLIISSDGGNSWSTPARVNQGTFQDGKEAYFPWITCDQATGYLAMVFYDDRNTPPADCETFSAFSTDAGNSWTDFVISDVSFTPNPIPGLADNYMGDYLGITAKNGKVYPCWTDNRNGQFMTYVSPYEIILTADFTSNCNLISTGSTVTFTDGSISVNPITSWNWSFPGGTPSSATGQGPHEVTYNSPGIYDVTLTVDDGTSTDTETKTGYIEVIQPASVLPWSEGFESAGPITYFTSSMASINGLCNWAYEKTSNGRLRFSSYVHSGVQSAALDAYPSGTSINYLIKTLDLSAYRFANDLELSFWYRNYGQLTNNCKVWIRGSNENDWVEIFQYTGNSWYQATGLDIDSVLTNNDQAITSGFQIKFGQEGDQPIVYEGLLLDDIQITGTLPQETTWTGTLSSDWNTAGNWDNNIVPDAGKNVIIPSSVASGNWPVLTGNLTVGTTCSNILLSGNSQLTVTGDVVLLAHKFISFDNSAPSTLNIGGNLTNNGNIITGQGNIEFTGTQDASMVAGYLDDNLTTIFGATYKRTSNYFDISASGTSDISVYAFDINTYTNDTVDVEIWYRTDPYSGHQSDPSGWIKLGNTLQVKGDSTDNPVYVKPDNPVLIPQGNTYGFFISCYKGYPGYILYKSAYSTTTYNDSKITITCGDGCYTKQPGLGGNYENKIWNGTVYYSYLSESGVLSLPNLTIGKSNAGVSTSCDVNVLGDFTINPKAYFTNSQGKNFNVNGNTVFKADTSGTASFIDNGTSAFANPPDVQSYISQDTWHMISAPVSNALSDVFLGIYLKYFNEPDYTWSYVTSTTFDLTEGRGFMVWSSSSSTGNSTVNYSGNLNNGDMYVNGLSYTPTQPVAERGWNMVGNPYPSSIEWNGVWGRTNIDATIYVYDLGASGNYLTYNTSGTGTLPNGYIAPAQGFWIKANNSGASLTIPQSERRHTPQPFFKKSGNKNELLITVKGNEKADKMIVMFDNNASPEFDSEFDAWKLKGDIDAPQLYAITKSGELTVNALPFEDDDLVVPVGLEAGTDATYNMEFDNSLNDEITVYLEDLLTGEISDISNNLVYKFTSSTKDTPHRFNLHFTKSGNDNIITDKHLKIYSYGNTVYVNNPSGSPCGITIYDVMGKVVASKQYSGDNMYKISLNTSPGYYVVKVRSKNNLTVKKVVIR